MMKIALTTCIFIITAFSSYAQSFNKPGNFSIIAYYAGDSAKVNAFPIEKLTHIIFSFGHLKGNKLFISNKKDSATIQQLVSLKSRNPSLKVILSLGGWGGCGPCSEVFSSKKGRKEFAKSVHELTTYFRTDGIDLDWEYPAIAGFPGHRYVPEDRQNFTLLVKSLRKTLGHRKEISFAAGGFENFLENSIDWKKVMPLVDKVNLMTYDLVHGFSEQTGHHTPLYSTEGQIESTDNAIRYLDSLGAPLNKLVIGAAFYARIFDVEKDSATGLYQKGKFNSGLSYARFDKDSLQKEGFSYYWDETAQAPYLYSPAKKQIITLDDERSIMLKTKYALDHHLNGIMFWQLADDKPANGLLDAIDRAYRAAILAQ